MTTNTKDLKALDDELNEMLRRGEFLPAIERLYAPDVEMQENGAEATRGRAANLAREKSFWGGVELHGARLVSQAIGDGVTMGEWELDWTIGGARSTLRQVAVRRWQGGLVAHERFYYKP